MNRLNISILIILFFLYSLVDLFSFSIMERLEMPSNNIYFKRFSIKIDKLEKKKEEKIKIEKNFKIKPIKPIILTGIFKIGKNFYAIINGDTYSTGDKINNFIIKSINIKEVVLVNKKNKKKMVLKIES